MQTLIHQAAKAPPAEHRGRLNYVSQFRASRQILGLLQLACLLATAAPVVLEHEADPVAFVEGADARRLERGGVDEHVLAAVLGRDKSEALGRIKEFHSTCDAHVGCSFPDKA